VDAAGIRQKLRGNIDAVEERIARACARAGRRRAEVTLVAVTKTVSAELAALLPELGILDLGENRPQELWKKAQLLPRETRWHLIGHLQRNKIEKTLPLTHLIHSVDSDRVLQALEKEAGKREHPVQVLLEVNASGEASKQGFAPATVSGLAATLQELKHVQIRGIMTMAAYQDPEACRPAFALVRELRQQLRTQLPPWHQLDHLSMGMSNDFEIAIEEGATLIRLGTVLFEGL
jgi:PLP dependent protein